MKNQLILAAFTAMLVGCSTSLDDYASSTPQFDLKQYFTGNVVAWGIVQDYSTKLTRRFCVDIVGTWTDNKGQLHETFYYNDGEQQVRVWHLDIGEDGLVTGTADDVVGLASGGQSGSAFNWKYTLRVPIDGTEYDFAIDDWMFQLDERRVMNRSYMSKLGVNVADISIFFDKTDDVKCSP